MPQQMQQIHKISSFFCTDLENYTCGIQPTLCRDGGLAKIPQEGPLMAGMSDEDSRLWVHKQMAHALRESNSLGWNLLHSEMQLNEIVLKNITILGRQSHKAA